LSAAPKSVQPIADLDAGDVKGRIWLKIGLYYVLAVLLTLPLELLIHGAQGNGPRVLNAGVMWCPALAAVLVTLLFRDNIRSLGWRWGSWRYIRWAFIIPMLYVLPAYLVVWVLGLGGFYDADFAATVTRDYGFAGAPAVGGLIGYVLLILTAGMTLSLARALGEEIGWRGFLVPQLAKLTSFTGVGLISGVMWSAWHYPGMLFGSYDFAGTPAWYGLICFTVMATSLGFIAAWLRLRSGSVWPAVILHGVHNTIVQSIFTPLTTNTGHTDWYIGEFGAALAVTTAIGAIIVWRKRHDLPATATDG
jgi:membrane protease YdiL (CAAX protease family)